MASRPEDPSDPVLVVIEEDEPDMTFDEWLALVAADGPAEIDAGAAEILRAIRAQTKVDQPQWRSANQSGDRPAAGSTGWRLHGRSWRMAYIVNRKDRWSGDRQALEPPDRLVVLLDHQYTERGLRWSHLKGDDAARIEVLRHAADIARCEVALAQAEIQETRECYDDDPPRWGRQRWSDWADEELDEGPNGRVTVGEILDSTLEIVPAMDEPRRFDRAVKLRRACRGHPHR